MTEIKLAIFATDTTTSTPNYLAHALLLKDSKSKKLICEIHIGKMITRFNPNANFFLEDMLWQLNDYCQIPTYEIESDMHYPDPVSIEEEFGVPECMQSREKIAECLNETGLSYLVVSWASVQVLNKINNLRKKCVKIDTTNFINLKGIEDWQMN